MASIADSGSSAKACCQLGSSCKKGLASYFNVLRQVEYRPKCLFSGFCQAATPSSKAEAQTLISCGLTESRISMPDNLSTRSLRVKCEPICKNKSSSAFASLDSSPRRCSWVGLND